MRARRGSQAGFTLIELMVVLVLMAIFSGLMLGEMRGTYEDALLRSTARKIVSAAQFANSRAVTENRAQQLRINPESHRLSIGSGQQSEPSEEETLDERIHIEIRPLTPAVEDDPDQTAEEKPSAETSLNQINFLPDGTASGREILLRDRLGVELWLRVNAVTGRVRVLESEAAP